MKLYTNLTPYLEGDALEEVLDVDALAMALFGDFTVGHEGALGTEEDAGGLDVVGGGLLAGGGYLASDAGAEGAESLEVDGIGVEQVVADGDGELDEHGEDVGVGHGGGVGDLVGQVLGGDVGVGHGLEIPLAVIFRTGHLVLDFSVKYWHNR